MEEVELGHRLWLRDEKVDVMGDERVEAADESRECDGETSVGLDIVSLSSCLVILGKDRERMRRMLWAILGGMTIGCD